MSVFSLVGGLEQKEPCWDDQRAQEGTGGGRVEGGRGGGGWRRGNGKGGGRSGKIQIKEEVGKMQVERGEERCRYRERMEVEGRVGRRRAAGGGRGVDSNTNLSSSVASRRGGGAMGTTKELLHSCKHTHNSV